MNKIKCITLFWVINTDIVQIFQKLTIVFINIKDFISRE